MPRYIDVDKLIELSTITRTYKGDSCITVDDIDDCPTEDVIPRDAVEIYGYPVKELALFATACRDAGATVAEMRNLADNVKMAYELVRNEFENSLKEALNYDTKKEE